MPAESRPCVKRLAAAPAQRCCCPPQPPGIALAPKSTGLRTYPGPRRLAGLGPPNRLDIRAAPEGSVDFAPIAPPYRVEHAFVRLGRWRRLSRRYEGTPDGARAWLEVAGLGYLFARLRAQPA